MTENSFNIHHQQPLTPVTAHPWQALLPSTLAHIDISDSGYLRDFDDWNETVLGALATVHNVVLDQHKYQLVHHLREQYVRLGKPQGLNSLRQLCRAQAISRKALRTLFGDCATLWKISGLPDPGQEARYYFTY